MLYALSIISPGAGTPEDMGHAEKAVGDILRLARAFMIGAPHLPPSLWGAAVMYSGVVNEILPKAPNGGITPYEYHTHRPPDLTRLDVRVKWYEKRKTKNMTTKCSLVLFLCTTSAL